MKKILQQVKKSKIILLLYKLLFIFVGFLPANKKLVVFESFLGKQYSDNPRAIYEYLKENYPNYIMYWSIDPRYMLNFTDKDILTVNRFSVKWLFILANARYWVTNSRMPIWIPKPKHTVYLQTWHGTPLKKLGMDIEEVHMHGTTTEQYKREFTKEAANWDYLVSPNSYSTTIFKRAFQFDKEVIESGYPRNDYLYVHNNEISIKELKQKFNIPLNKKVILYAPTWRDNQYDQEGKYKLDIKLELNQMKENLQNDYIVILRMHYLVANNMDISTYEGFVLDFSNHEDIRELYLMADILITDYSSVFFDYANLKRPMIFYAYDIEDYRDQLRGFYFDFEQKAPGPIVRTTEEVIRVIDNIQNGSLDHSNLDEFYQEFTYLESGISTMRVVNRVFANK
ncbi:CDP-glycerol glycerophosphotransferase family protein [Bacillus sp. RD4P76]|uniref:CDP-glycerol glycerophosphotransferase family protein n=1 Tax=Bacillus suaedaesalsae TaxID=2810349 RepID=A0ABS2DKW3_9BACI|nr:CDP-glycerol glycerophosphotransferase family protein [Bacillus suaedaesalsae]MBM6619083.1 CDP-glycerol glycerophosphotransferase family protein [Bacillus suaedaesalsae]